MRNPKHKFVSFDLDGTLIRLDFSTAVWHEAIPELLSHQRSISFDDALKWVSAQYETVGEGSLEWYDLAYWYERFELDEPWQETLRRYRTLIRPFPEVEDVLETLARDHQMIILSNASRPFIRAELQEGGLNGLFEHVISATTDFGEVKKTEAFYTKVCQALNVGARDVVHVGDHWEFDYVAPTRAGLRAYYLDRTRHSNGPGVVHDLNEFAREVLNESGTS